MSSQYSTVGLLSALAIAWTGSAAVAQQVREGPSSVEAAAPETPSTTVKPQIRLSPAGPMLVLPNSASPTGTAAAALPKVSSVGTPAGPMQVVANDASSGLAPAQATLARSAGMPDGAMVKAWGSGAQELVLAGSEPLAGEDDTKRTGASAPASVEPARRIVDVDTRQPGSLPKVPEPDVLYRDVAAMRTAPATQR